MSRLLQIIMEIKNSTRIAIMTNNNAENDAAKLITLEHIRDTTNKYLGIYTFLIGILEAGVSLAVGLFVFYRKQDKFIPVKLRLRIHSHVP